MSIQQAALATYSSLAKLINKFVDSVTGLDSDPGTSETLAKQTLAGVQAVAVDGDTVGMARASNWREQITLAGLNIDYAVTGTGAIPVIDGADVATGWTRPDPTNLPNIWLLSWTRNGPITGSDDLGLWVGGVRPRIALSISDLNTNGGWFVSGGNYRTIVSDVHIKSTTNPNTNGVLYEITRRNSGFNWHAQTSTSTATVNIVGPLEIKRAVGHYNAIAAGAGTVKQVLLRDGHIHHTVTMGSLTEDCIATEMRAGANGVPFTAYRADGVGFSHTFKRCLALFDGGAARIPAANGFYAHASLGNTLIDQINYEECIVRGMDGFAAAASVQNVSNAYVEDANAYAIDLNGFTTTINRCMVFHTADTLNAAGALGLRNANSQAIINVTDLAVFNKFGPALSDVVGTGSVSLTNCSLVTQRGHGLTGGDSALNYSVIDTLDGRSFSFTEVGFSGNHNVFFAFTGNPSEPWLHYNSTLYSFNSLAGFQTASGSNANSVYTKVADQTSGNALAFWLGVKNGTGGPEVGDFRINPNCRVYDAAHVARTGTFTDGVAVTLAGPQTHWNYNTRTIASGPPAARPILPATIADMRTYINDPTTWSY